MKICFSRHKWFSKPAPSAGKEASSVARSERAVSWRVSLFQRPDRQVFLVNAPAAQIEGYISFSTMPDGWSCQKITGWICLDVPATINNAFTLQWLLEEQVKSYAITDEAQEALSHLLDLPGWCEI